MTTVVHASDQTMADAYARHVLEQSRQVAPVEVIEPLAGFRESLCVPKFRITGTGEVHNS